MAGNTSTLLWAAYLEVTHGEGANRARQQWIFLPPMLENQAPIGAPVISNPSYFYRRQSNPDNKTVWQHRMLDAEHKYTALHEQIEAAELRGWVAKPIITCEVHPLEMRDIASDWKTPYRVLNRMIRVAERLHGFKI